MIIRTSEVFIPRYNATCTYFFTTAPATPNIYSLSLHDALPILAERLRCGQGPFEVPALGIHLVENVVRGAVDEDRKSTRLNSSHVAISYAVFCLKKKKKVIDI